MLEKRDYSILKDAIIDKIIVSDNDLIKIYNKDGITIINHDKYENYNFKLKCDDDFYDKKFICFYTNKGIFIQIVGHEDYHILELKEIDGDLIDLLNTPILLAEEVIVTHPQSVDNHRLSTSSWYKLSTISGSVTISWWGSASYHGYAMTVQLNEVVGDLNAYDIYQQDCHTDHYLTCNIPVFLLRGEF